MSAALGVLAHPARLPILLALEQRPQTAQDLVDGLKLDPHKVKFSMQQLRSAALIEVVDTRDTGTSLLANVYGVRRRGWKKLLRALADLSGGE